MQAPLSLRLPLEVFHRIGDIGSASVDPCIDQSPVQQKASRTDEGAAAAVLAVAGLLAHDHDPCSRGTFAKDRLRCVPEKRASRADRRG